MILMEQSTEEPQQRKQPSRKGKKAWRKHVDLSDVQTGLEQARDEVIKGGIIAEKPSTDLFTFDTTGSVVIQRSYNKTHKPLKADQILAQRSAVPAIDSHKRPGITNGIIEPRSKKRKTNGVSPREYERLREVAYGSQTVKDVIKTDDAPDYDPWIVKSDEEEQDPRFSYLEKAKPIRAPSTIKEAPISLAAGKGEVPAVPAPKPGTSYNPVLEDWDALLITEGQKEVEAEKKRLLEAAREQERLARIAAAENEPEYDNGVQTEEESAWEGFESEYEGAEWLKKKRSERKTPAERNRINRKKEAERREKWEKKEREKEKQERRVAEIVKMAKEEAKRRELMTVGGETEVQEEVDDRVLRRRKFGKDALPEPPLELVLPDELQDSLRLLKPEGNLLKDRFRNILVRGKMETRKPIQQPKKKRRTYTEKWTFKDMVVPT